MYVVYRWFPWDDLHALLFPRRLFDSTVPCVGLTGWRHDDHIGGQLDKLLLGQTGYVLVQQVRARVVVLVHLVAYCVDVHGCNHLDLRS